MQTYVSFTQQDDIGYLTFACDEPNKPATLDHRVLDELAERLEGIRSGIDGLRAVVVRSASAKYFIVGANIKALEMRMQKPSSLGFKKGTLFSTS